MQAAMSAAGVNMVIMEAVLCHATPELDPKQGHAAQGLLVLHIVLEVQQTLKIAIPNPAAQL